MVKAEVCKTSIQRFESARRLHARRWLTGWLVPLLLVATLPGTVVAGQILQLKPYSGSSDFIAYDPFDPVSGTLDQVRVSIDGMFSGSVVTPPNGPPCCPTPYPVPVQVEQLWFGLAGRGFDFNNPARMILSPPLTASGLGGGLGFTQPYSISFRFDATTDLAGFAPPTSASGVQPPSSAHSPCPW